MKQSSTLREKDRDTDQAKKGVRTSEKQEQERLWCAAAVGRVPRGGDKPAREAQKGFKLKVEAAQKPKTDLTEKEQR